MKRTEARIEDLERRLLRPEKSVFHIYWPNEVIDHGDGTITLPDGTRTAPGDHLVRLHWPSAPDLWSDTDDDA